MKRELVWQAILLVLVAGLAWQLLSVTQANLARLGVSHLCMHVLSTSTQN